MSSNSPVLLALRASSKGQLCYKSKLDSDVPEAERKEFFDLVNSPPALSPGIEDIISRKAKRLSLDDHTPHKPAHTPHTPSPLHTPLHTHTSHHTPHGTLSSPGTLHPTPSSNHAPQVTPSHATRSSHNTSRGYSLNIEESDDEQGDFPDAESTSLEQISHVAVKGDSPDVSPTSSGDIPHVVTTTEEEPRVSVLEEFEQKIEEESESIDDLLLQERLEQVRSRKEFFYGRLEKIRREADGRMEEIERERQERLKIEEEERLLREEQEDKEIMKTEEALQERYNDEAKIMAAKLKSGEEQKREIMRNIEERRRRAVDKLKTECQELADHASQIETKLTVLFQSCSHSKFLAQTVVNKFGVGISGMRRVRECLLIEKQSAQPGQDKVTQFHDTLNRMGSVLTELKAAVEEANLLGEREAKKQQSLLEEAAKKLEAEKKLELEKLAKEAQEAEKKREEEKRRQSERDASGLTISKSMLESFSSLQDMLCQTLETCKSLMSTQDSALKKYRFDLQKAITGSINQVSSNSGQDLLQKIFNLKNLLSGKSIQVGTKSVNIGGHPDAKAYCFNLLAVKFVKQGEDQVASSAQAAFPLAALAVGIWTDFEEVGQYMLAHFYSVCPVLVPMYVTRTNNMSEAEYMRSLGYMVSSDGKVENQDLFLNRVRGIVRLYAAIIQTPQLPTSQMPRPHPHGLEYGWAWLARMLNVEPHPVVTAAALGDFLEIAGHSLMKKYTKQFQKLLYSLWKEYIPKIEKVTLQADRGPLARLTQFLEDCIAAGRIPQPKGCLTEQFWRAKSSGIQTA